MQATRLPTHKSEVCGPSICGNLGLPSEGLGGTAALAVENYGPPCSEHGHLPDGEWHRDINDRYGGRPHMLKGDPDHSFVWTRSVIRLNESLPLSREPGWYGSKNEFANHLVRDYR